MEILFESLQLHLIKFGIEVSTPSPNNTESELATVGNALHRARDLAIRKNIATDGIEPLNFKPEITSNDHVPF